MLINQHQVPNRESPGRWSSIGRSVSRSVSWVMVVDPLFISSSLLGSSCLTGPRRALTLALRRNCRRRLFHFFLARSSRRCRLFRARLCARLCSHGRTAFGVGAILERGGRLLSSSQCGCDGLSVEIGQARDEARGKHRETDHNVNVNRRQQRESVMQGNTRGLRVGAPWGGLAS